MRTLSISAAVVVASLLSAACGGGGTGSGGSGGTGGTGGTGGSGGTGGMANVMVSVSPASPTVLTCSQQTFSATVTGTSDTSVAWSATGMIDDKGVYTAPIQVPMTPSVTITATSNADMSAKGTATVTLATAVIGQEVSVVDTGIADVSVYQHQIASRGDRVYEAYATHANEVMVRRSDDAGKTWGAPVNAATGIDVEASCVAIAVDAASADVLHVVYRLPGTLIYESVSSAGTSNDAIVLATSSDGGATWKRSPLILGGIAGGPFNGHDGVGICPDVISPAKDAVIVESCGEYSGDGNPDMFLFADANRGAGFAAGTAAGGDYQANGETTALATTARNIGMYVADNGGSGDVTESPRLFTDGKGKTCVVWYGYSNTDSSDGVFVQCSTDLGKTFSAPVAVTKGGTTNPHVPAGAIGPNGEIVVVWHADSDPAGTLLIATSTDGKTFTGPTAIPLYTTASDTGLTGGDSDVAFDDSGVLWVTYYLYDGGLTDRVIIDKSCDGGKTWSGAMLVNGPEGSVMGAGLPGLVPTKGAISVHTFLHVGDTDGGASQMARLVP